MRTMAGLWSVLALLAVPLSAQAPRVPVDVDRLGPQVGERVPGFTLRDQSGRLRTLESIMGPKGALIVFYRSVDW